AGAVALAYLPILLGARYLAPLADRIATKPLLIGLDATRAALMLPLLLFEHNRTGSAVTVTLALIALLSFTSPMFSAGQSACLRRTMADPQLTRALGIVSSIEWLTFTVGTAVGALLLLSAGMRTVVVADILTFIASLAMLARFLPRAPDLAPAPLRPR